MEEHAIELAREPRAALAAVARAASEWGAELTPREGGGRLRLPVVSGLRRGWEEGELAVEPAEGGSRLTFQVERSESHLRLAAVAILLLGGAGGLVLLLWPFFPRLLRLTPLAAVLALAAWFAVLARLSVSGPREFLELTAAVIGEGEEEEEGDAEARESPPAP